MNSRDGGIKPSGKQYDPEKDAAWHEVRAEINALRHIDPDMPIADIANKVKVSEEAVEKAIKQLDMHKFIESDL